MIIVIAKKYNKRYVCSNIHEANKLIWDLRTRFKNTTEKDYEINDC